MRIHHNDGKFEIECSRDALILLNNALNNIPQAVDAKEYTALIGATEDDVLAVLMKINEALHHQD